MLSANRTSEFLNKLFLKNDLRQIIQLTAC